MVRIRLGIHAYSTTPKSPLMLNILHFYLNTVNFKLFISITQQEIRPFQQNKVIQYTPFNKNSLTKEKQKRPY